MGLAMAAPSYSGPLPIFIGLVLGSRGRTVG